MSKPELLLPAGNIEAFFAALEGGADAIYLGLKQFNARGRAANFLPAQLTTMAKIAAEKGVKLYVTLNTVIKNSELPELLDTLFFLSKTKIAAVIIQDWGSYHLIKKYFPGLVFHASTQMANHNSAGVNFSAKMGFERVILARELTLDELELTMKKAKTEVEIFIHGALCYSFSGMCLFSSYLGGQGANRGQCTQPCRRLFKGGKKEKFIFSLKDNEQLKNIDSFKCWGVASLKIEGRMKSAEYVYRVASAYRMALDNVDKKEEAAKLLAFDFGREKTNYFMGDTVRDAISQSPLTGIFLGRVMGLNNGTFEVESHLKLEERFRLRVIDRAGNQVAFKIKELTTDDESENWPKIYNIYTDKSIRNGDRVFLAGMPDMKFPTKFERMEREHIKPFPVKVKQRIISELKFKRTQHKPEFYVRIDSFTWLRKIRLDEVDFVIFSLSTKEMEELQLDAPFLKKNAKKIFFELPGFISEKKLRWYRQWITSAVQKGFKQFSISHLSQVDVLPKGVTVLANDKIYIYNDAAAKALTALNINLFTYPLENDFENLKAGTSRDGILPVYATPELFYSRMPVKIENQEGQFIDDNGHAFNRVVRDGLTSVYPEVPMAWLHYGSKFKQEGFYRFMFDLRGQSPSKHLLPRLIKKFRLSEQIQPSTTFNFKRGLG